MAKKDLEWRKKKNARQLRKAEDNFIEAGFIKPMSQWPTEAGFTARVVEVQKRFCFVSPEREGEIDTRDVWLATVAGKFLTKKRLQRNLVCVGDRVWARKASTQDLSEDLPQCTVEYLAPRENRLARLDPLYENREHVLASNVDQLVMVSSVMHPKVKWGLIDRYLVLAEAEGIAVILVFNKADLLKDEDQSFQDEFSERVGLYEGLGYPTLIISASGGPEAAKLPALTQVFQDKVSLISGHSGVGKSSIANLLGPEIVQDVESELISYKGRHTTTYASMIKLAVGGHIIDTPGIRSFCFPEKTALDLSACFRDFKPFLGTCKYRKCRHFDEPGCAIKAAVENGEVEKWRYKSYLSILSGASGREGRIRDLDL